MPWEQNSAKWANCDSQPYFLWMVGLAVSRIIVADSFLHFLRRRLDGQDRRPKEAKTNFNRSNSAKPWNSVLFQILQFLRASVHRRIFSFRSRRGSVDTQYSVASGNKLLDILRIELQH